MSAEKLNLTYPSNCITLQSKLRYVLHFGTIYPLTVLQNFRNTCGRLSACNFTKNKISLQASLTFYSLVNSLKLQNMLHIWILFRKHLNNA